MLLKELQKLWGLVLLKRSPADIQYSYLLLGLVLGLVVLAQWMAKLQSLPDASNALWLMFIPVLLLLRIAPFLFFKRSERIVQSLTALFGTDLLINLPLLLALHVLDATQQSLILVVLFYFAHTWRFVVSAYIYKLALDINWIKAFAVVFAIAVANIIVVVELSNLLSQN